MKSIFHTRYDEEEIKHLKKLAEMFNLKCIVDEPTVSFRCFATKVAVMVIGDVEDVNKFEKQYQQYIAYRDRLRDFFKNSNK